MLKPLSKKARRIGVRSISSWSANYLLFSRQFWGANRAHGDNRQCKHAALCVPMPQDTKPFNQHWERAGNGQELGNRLSDWLTGVRIRTVNQTNRRRAVDECTKFAKCCRRHSRALLTYIRFKLNIIIFEFRPKCNTSIIATSGCRQPHQFPPLQWIVGQTQFLVMRVA